MAKRYCVVIRAVNIDEMNEQIGAVIKSPRTSLVTVNISVTQDVYKADGTFISAGDMIAAVIFDEV